MKANVKYCLSQAGQKAALISGRPATSTVAETMEFEDTHLIDKLHINTDGTMSYDRAGYSWPSLDAPPANLAELIATIEAWSTAKRAAEDATKREAEEKARLLAERSFPVVERLLAAFEAMPLDSPAPPAGLSAYGFDDVTARGTDGYILSSTPEQRARRDKRFAERKAFADEKAAAEKAAKLAAREAMIAEHGGIVFPVEAGMCSFTGQGLWSSGQSKRWVGIFSAMKGIDSFCDSPRGEHSFGVSALHRGHCIQGGGYDTNSRGKRRSETEWFGVVVRCDENEIVVDLHDSRAATIKAAVNELSAESRA